MVHSVKDLIPSPGQWRHRSCRAPTGRVRQCGARRLLGNCSAGPQFLSICPMTTGRRVAGPNAKNSGVLLDAAERLMLEEGYVAVTSRRVAAEAGLKPQLVHYYFRTMDDLFLEVFRRRAKEGIERQTRALASEHPLRALWEYSIDPRGN